MLKTLLAEIFCTSECLLTQTQLIKIHNSLDSSRPSGRLLENHKTGASRKLFLNENDCQTSLTKFFPKNIQILEVWKPTEDMKSRLDFFFTCSLTYNSI